MLARSSVESHILAASLQFVPTHGWSNISLGEGAKSLGYSNVAHGLFPKGGIELVEYFVRRTTGEVREEMETTLDLSKLSFKLIINYFYFSTFYLF